MDNNENQGSGNNGPVRTIDGGPINKGLGLQTLPDRDTSSSSGQNTGSQNTDSGSDKK
jgi:hypothetical protein